MLGARTVDRLLRPFPAAGTGSGLSTATLVDPLGLERVEHRLDEETDVARTAADPRADDGVLVPRPARGGRCPLGVPTSDRVRDPRRSASTCPGEPLRAVHWPSTARRGQLDGEGARRRTARGRHRRSRPRSRGASPALRERRASTPRSAPPARSRSPICCGDAASRSSARARRRILPAPARRGPRLGRRAGRRSRPSNPSWARGSTGRCGRPRRRSRRHASSSS